MPNSNVWFCIPSARPPAEAADCLLKWHERGYRLAVWRDKDDELGTILEAAGAWPLILIGKYPGYAMAVNALTLEAQKIDHSADFFVTGGDDTLPDPADPRLIAAQIKARFGGTFAVMQPTGDSFADNSITKIAGSPWMGREFCRRMNGGQGPFYPGFVHMFGDQVLQEVSIKLGVFWQRPDLCHHHNHFCRVPGSDTVDWSRKIPDHLVTWNSREHWNEAHKLYETLKANGFRECMPIP